MNFSSIAECEAFIRKAMGSTAEEIALDLKDEAKEVISEEVKGISGQMEETPTVICSAPSSIIVQIVDNGSPVMDEGEWATWWSYGEKAPFFPIYGLEMGKTWHRDKTNIMEKWGKEAEEIILDGFATSMRIKGVPVE